MFDSNRALHVTNVYFAASEVSILVVHNQRRMFLLNTLSKNIEGNS